MTSQLVIWIEHDLERRSARQRAQIESSKLLASLSLTSAGAIVAAALQVNHKNGWKTASLVILLLAFLGTLTVILLDRTTEVNQERILGRGRGKADDTLVQELFEAFSDSVDINEAVVRSVRIATGIQVLLATLASTAGVLSVVT